MRKRFPQKVGLNTQKVLGPKTLVKCHQTIYTSSRLPQGGSDMQLKKLAVTLLAVAVASVSFALPSPQDVNPVADDALQQYAAQMEELNKTFDKTILPPLKGLLGTAKEFAESEAENPTPAQEKQLENYQNQLLDALNQIVDPIIEQIDINEYNQQMKQMLSLMGQTMDQEFTREDLSDQMSLIALLSAINHFAESGALTEEELELAAIIFFPEEVMGQ